ncbi:nucleoside 2-deoxyribosyltransferase [Niallia taxi]|uniref:nucleoside 2-deoxyribosyltransferase n=1 Tax=Niallia taxi TaxID=2499688 RepID=UPI0021A4E818|nr:nucleoside 2-deoxyribosyltransferase [Niallia taxi]MCT2347099.1 nucleoside 2-deoxyribosyltransferase [Niallia taxi]
MSENKTCFIVTPIGGNNTSIRRHADGVIDAVIGPVLEEKGFEIIVAHRISEGGSINRQVIENLINADMVVANLTGLNPNVMYELAIRHAIRKPLIQICEEDTNLPFDIIEQRTIFYSNDMQGVVELTSNFKKMLDAAINDEKPDNPLYRAIQLESIIQKDDVSSAEKFLLNRMDQLERTVLKAFNNSQKKLFKGKVYGSQSYGVADTMLTNKDQQIISENIEEIISGQGAITLESLYNYMRNQGYSYPLPLLGEYLENYIQENYARS